jgi:hypothetical protein
MAHFVCYLLEAFRARERGGGGGTSPLKLKLNRNLLCVHLCAPPCYGQGLKQACAREEGGGQGRVTP